jgi:hypothetical protein
MTDDIHTCHAECDRPICVAVREAVEAEREACAKVAERYCDRNSVVPFLIRERGAP